MKKKTAEKIWKELEKNVFSWKNKWKKLSVLIFWVLFVISLFFFDWVELNTNWNDTIAVNQNVDFVIDDLEYFWWEILTSPNKENWNAREEYASSSDTFFYGWLYSLTKREAKDMLHRLADDWKDVRMIFENKQYKDFHKSWEHILEEFEGSDVQLMTDEHLWLNFNHTKTFVNDNYAIIQSANLTQSAFTTNTEHFFVTSYDAIRENLIELFKMDRAWVSYGDAEIHPNLLVCPINCRAKIVSIIESAENSVYIMHQYLKDDALTDLVDQKIEEGVNVRLILSDNDSNYLLVNDRGKDVVTIQKKPYVHTKVILVDNKYLIIWSMNLSQNALDKNREIGIIILNEDLIEYVRSQFYN